MVAYIIKTSVENTPRLQSCVFTIMVRPSTITTETRVSRSSYTLPCFPRSALQNLVLPKCTQHALSSALHLITYECSTTACAYESSKIHV